MERRDSILSSKLRAGFIGAVVAEDKSKNIVRE